MRIESFDWDGRDARGLAVEIRGLQPALGEVSGAVAEIIGEVRSGGDLAVAEIEARVGGGGLEPGETAAYPSTVLMGCIPARVAGIDRVALATPPREGQQPISDLVLAAAAV